MTEDLMLTSTQRLPSSVAPMHLEGGEGVPVMHGPMQANVVPHPLQGPLQTDGAKKKQYHGQERHVGKIREEGDFHDDDDEPPSRNRHKKRTNERRTKRSRRNSSGGSSSSSQSGRSSHGRFPKKGKDGEAKILLAVLFERDVVAWTVMLQAYIEQGKAKMALQMYQKMQKEGVSPDEHTFAIVLKAWCNYSDEEANKNGEDISGTQATLSGILNSQVYFHAKELIKVGKLPFKSPIGRDANDIDNMMPNVEEGTPPIYHRTNGASLDEEKITIDGLPSLDRRDFPTFLQIEDSSDVMFSYFIEHVKTGVQASMVLFNTFEALDGALLGTLRLQGVPAHAIGPLFMLEDAITKKQAPHTEKEKANLPNQVQKGEECLKWLDKQKPNSVIYVAFGTMDLISWAQMKELANGLLNSGHPFIWTCQRLLEGNGETETETEKEFTTGFLKQCQGNGLVLEWAPQKRILNHPSTGFSHPLRLELHIRNSLFRGACLVPTLHK
ncbi:hypothetical protein L7F22_013928 [Adiantum nelumboides]|nr:hypothetical protein [Adiantum nelumboides]